MRETATLLGPASVAIIGPRRLYARRAERVISERRFPSYLWMKVVEEHPEAASDEGKALVERGLRDWFICCAWRKGRPLGMPSKLVDTAWHELILDTSEYIGFCRAAFGYYLQHFPVGKPSWTPSDDFSHLLLNTLRAWDESKAGKSGEESPMWTLDTRLGVAEPWGVRTDDLLSVRENKYEITAGASFGHGAAAMGAAGALLPEGGGGVGVGCGGGGCGGSGCGGGGGCGSGG